METFDKFSLIGLGLFCIFFSMILPDVLAQQVPALNIPPTNAFDKIHGDTGTISAINYSMPLNIKGGIGITITATNSTHTVTISSSGGSGTGTGSYNTTQANNVNINTGGFKLNFINGTNNAVNVINSPTKNQANITINNVYNSITPHYVTSSRAFNTVYHNTTGKTMIVILEMAIFLPVGVPSIYEAGMIGTSNPPTNSVTEQGIIQQGSAALEDLRTDTLIVPPNYYYEFVINGGGGSSSINLNTWTEFY